GLLHRPRLLVLDEPTVGVDPQSRNYIFETIRTLRAGGMTIVYTSHYMEEVEALCDRVAIMDHGAVIAQGTVAGLIAAPAGGPGGRADGGAGGGDRRARSRAGGRRGGDRGGARGRRRAARRGGRRRRGRGRADRVDRRAAARPRGRVPRADRPQAEGREVTRR